MLLLHLADIKHQHFYFILYFINDLHFHKYNNHDENDLFFLLYFANILILNDK